MKNPLGRPFVDGRKFVIQEVCFMERPKLLGPCYWGFENRELHPGEVVEFTGLAAFGHDAPFEEQFKVVEGPNSGFTGTLPNCWGATLDKLLKPFCGFCRGVCAGQHTVSQSSEGY